MKVLVYRLILLSLILTISSCGEKGMNLSGNKTKDKIITEPIKVSEPELIHWVNKEENGLIQSKIIDDLRYSSMYKPIDFLVAQEIANRDTLKLADKENIRKSYSNMFYFTYKISTDKWQNELLKYKLKSNEEYYARLEYCSFKAQNDFTLLNGKDTLPCKLFHFERTFGIAPVLTFVLGFERKSKNSNELTLVFNDHIFSSGIVKLNYSEKVMAQIPVVIQ